MRGYADLHPAGGLRPPTGAQASCFRARKVKTGFAVATTERARVTRANPCKTSAYDESLPIMGIIGKTACQWLDALPFMALACFSTPSGRLPIPATCIDAPEGRCQTRGGEASLHPAQVWHLPIVRRKRSNR